MRSDFTMALLICGTLIVALPPISDQMHNQDIKELLSRSETGSVYLEGRMSTEYRIACYLLGAGMIAAAVIGTLRAGSRHADALGSQDRSFADTIVPPTGHHADESP